MVTELSALGLRNEDICAMIKTSIPTLLKHYEKEIREGRIKANAKIAQTLYKKAIDGDTACLIFWAKTRLGWKEDPTTAIQINNQVNNKKGPDDYTDEELVDSLEG
jgi:hypothetical protein